MFDWVLDAHLHLESFELLKKKTLLKISRKLLWDKKGISFSKMGDPQPLTSVNMDLPRIFSILFLK